MQKLKVLLFLLIAIPIFSQNEKPTNSGKEEVYVFDRLTIIYHPQKLPISIDKEFIPQGADIIVSTEYRGNFYESAESSLIYTTQDKKEDILKFYEEIFKLQEWRILQKEAKDNAYMLLTESPYKKIFTVHIQDEINKRKVKLFFRKTGVSF
ncbi:MAG: hypothetical protein KDK90_08160 [Leptospiraceae bacterium]|nr:hypothetical protein [Leptospiraceae bacterium]